MAGSSDSSTIAHALLVMQILEPNKVVLIKNDRIIIRKRPRMFPDCETTLILMVDLTGEKSSSQTLHPL